jgi:hypothetical protein
MEEQLVNVCSREIKKKRPNTYGLIVFRRTYQSLSTLGARINVKLNLSVSLYSSVSG